MNSLIKILCVWGCLWAGSVCLAQDDLSIDLDELELPEQRLPLCFGFSDISDFRALAVCDALNLKENVKARELSEQWVRAEPESPAAQFALAEVLLTVEGNMPRALFHLNRAEELTPYTTMEQAFESGNVQWHYLTVSQLSYVHQLMGDQLKSLEYLDKLEAIYGQDVESFRGWPLIKLKQYEAARTSANRVLQTSDDERARARAWNTLCAVELASLAPIESTSACDRAISEDEDIANRSNDFDTVYLTNASEVALSLLQMDVAEDYLDRATRYLNPDSVADPWIYKLYLTLNQGRFDDARDALDRMMVWRGQQEPLVSVMNRAEHFLVSASFLMVAGYAEDAARLSQTALNQPDRNGSYSADDAQKDAFAALLNMTALRAELEIQKELRATMDWSDALRHRLHTANLGLQAWRSERRAASLFASFEVLQNRLRPYAPLDVHIPEWVEPDLVQLIGTGVMSEVLGQARANGAFQLNEGYFYAYQTEINAVDKDFSGVIDSGRNALELLPAAEILLRARVAANMGQAMWAVGDETQAIELYQQAYTQDPSIIRRLGFELPVRFTSDNSALAADAIDYLRNSPRFFNDANGFILEVRSSPGVSACLRTPTGTALSCYNLSDVVNAGSVAQAKDLVDGFHNNT
ncbi:MAG: hypothetical protein MI746_04130, partial [Pseudomonadales bacterium]|nr:hypothetical protein [Pseudomonadales bacterium]